MLCTCTRTSVMSLISLHMLKTLLLQMEKCILIFVKKLKM